VALREAGDSGAGVPPPPPASTQVMATPVPAAGPVVPVAPTPDTQEAPAARVTTTKTQNRWPLYAAGALALIVVVALLVAHPWTNADTTADNPPGTGDTVRVRAAAYIGEPVQEVEAALADKGLKTKTSDRDNSGNHDAGTVAALDPTGKVEKGTTITLDVWGDPPADEGDNSGKGDGKTKPPKPDKTQTTDKPDPGNTDGPEPSVIPDTGNTGNTNGTDNGNGTDNQGAGGATSDPGSGGRGVQPSTGPGNGTKGD
jgi:hypothetical protein